LLCTLCVDVSEQHFTVFSGRRLVRIS
jgi:hypothetical protein